MPHRFHWAVALGFAISCVGYAIASAWQNYSDPFGLDFVSFWAAAKLAFQGTPALAYDITAHRTIELSVGRVPGLMPFAYPPTFLLIILPLGLLTFWAAFATWVAVTGTFYALAARTLIKGPYPLANPAGLLVALNGQNGFFTAGLFIGGTSLLDRCPYVAGAILGLLSIKPQLAALIPVALLAGGQWRALAGAAASTIALLLLSASAFGIESYRAFFEQLPVIVDAMRSSRLPMFQLTSVYGLLRYFHAPEAVSVVAHVAVAAGAAIVTWLAWRRESPAKVPILAAASLLISPYIYIYDTLLLTVPMAFLLLRGDRVWVAVIWLLSLLSLGQVLTGAPIPNLLGIAAILSLWTLHRDAGTRQSREESLPHTVKMA